MASFSFRPFSRSWKRITLVAALVGVPGLVAALSPSPAPAELLGISAQSLTSYLANDTPTTANDVTPVALQRAVRMDGSLRASPGMAIAVSNSPIASPWTGMKVLNGVDLRTGSFSPNEVDISLPSTGVPMQGS